MDTSDIPAALNTLDERITKLETAPPPAASSSSPATDPRTDDIFAVLERYFGKELAEAKAAREQPAAPAPTPAAPVTAPQNVNVTPGPITGTAPGP